MGKRGEPRYRRLPVSLQLNHYLHQLRQTRCSNDFGLGKKPNKTPLPTSGSSIIHLFEIRVLYIITCREGHPLQTENPRPLTYDRLKADGRPSVALLVRYSI